MSLMIEVNVERMYLPMVNRFEKKTTLHVIRTPDAPNSPRRKGHYSHSTKDSLQDFGLVVYPIGILGVWSVSWQRTASDIFRRKCSLIWKVIARLVQRI